MLKNEFNELSEEYLNDIHNRINILRNDIKNKNIYSIMLFIHKIKGSGASFGFPELTDVGRKMEDVVKDIDWKKLNSHFNELIEIFNKISGKKYA